MNRRPLFSSLLTAAVLAQVAVAQPAAPAPTSTPTPQPEAVSKPPGLGLKDGDRFIFIGDSITHACQYTQFVENFFYTRYPEKRLRFRNAGISGDRAQDVLNRWDEDIAAFKPTVATILLGMNDGSYRDFDLPTFQTYAKGMTEILDRLDVLKCRVIIMSPTMFDHQSWGVITQQKPDYAKGRVPTNYNAVLAFYGKWLQETARVRGYEFVDLFSPLNTLTVEGRRTNPNFTLIPDAIHPGLDGALVMAYSLLQQVGETGDILSSGVKLVQNKWKALDSNIVTDVIGEAGTRVSYTIQPKALPWAVFKDAPLGAKLTRAGETASQESLIVSGLKDGQYDLRINGQYVGTWDERMLGIQAEIEGDPDSPTYQQAMRVVALNKKRNMEAISPLRGQWIKQKGMFAKQNVDKAAYDAWQVEFKAKRAELDALGEKYEDEIYKANQLQPLKVEVLPSTGVQPAPATAAPAAKKAA